MLSIIIPVHNSEKYLNKCLDSILNQTYKDLEIILIENLSTDSSKKICEDYVKSDSRVKLMIESKKGAAAARNCGIREANGEYISFVDSDDYVDHNAYKIIINKMIQENADLGCFSFEYINENDDKLNWYTPKLSRYKRDVVSGKDIAKIFLTSRDIEGFGWNKVFKTAIFKDNNILFEENKTAYEDMAILFDAICCCKIAILIPKKLYFYRQIKSSLTHENYRKKNTEYMDSIAHISSKAKELKLYKELKAFFITRKIMALYGSLKSNEFNNLLDYYEKENFFYELWIILTTYKSERAKIIIKAIRVKIAILFNKSGKLCRG